MKKLYAISGLLLLFLCAGTFAFSQNPSFKSITEELQSLQKHIVPDKRVAILEIELRDTIHQTQVLSGETNLPNAKRQIIGFLTDKNVSYIDSLRLLPGSDVGEKTWALTTLSVSNLRAKPDDASELVSQAPMGTPLKVLENKAKWYRVQTPDNYIGWMDSGCLKTFTALEMDQWKNSARYIFNCISGFVYDKPSKKGKIVSDLVVGDLFVVEKKTGRFLKIVFPDGRTGFVRKSHCLSFNNWSNMNPGVAPVLDLAQRMNGFPYLWGGTSSKGADCSGFVKLAFYSQGIILARDASQQARYGEPIDIGNINTLQPGDLVFFGRSAQRITHVGIYLGNGYFIHASGRVHVSSLDPADPKFVPERNFVAARRILNSLDTDGVVSVKNHPWY